MDGVGVDVFPVYQSKLGRRLQMPVEVLINHTEKIDRTRVLTAEAQFVTKMAALLHRPDTLPWEKDRREMIEGRAMLRLNRARAHQAAVSVNEHAQDLAR